MRPDVPFLREKLDSADGVPVGLFVKMPSRETCEIVAHAGFDFVVIDTEHAPLGVREVYEMVRTFHTLGVAPIVRVLRGPPGESQRVLDLGAAGVMIPHVHDAEDARRATDPLLFPPSGSRGSGFASPAGLWGGLTGGKAEYLRFGNDDVVRIAMLEDPGAVDAASAIASVPGIDAVFVGASDLALSMGLASGSPDVEARVDRAIEASVTAGVPAGVIATAPEDVRRRIEQGCSFLIAGNDTGLFRAAVTNRLDDLIEAVKGARHGA